MATETKDRNPQIVQIPAETASVLTRWFIHFIIIGLSLFHLSINSLLFRPSASSGWWLGYLLAIAYSVSYWKHERSSSLEYKLSTIVIAGLALETTTIFIGMRTKTKVARLSLYFVAPSLTSFFVFYCLHQGLLRFPTKITNSMTKKLGSFYRLYFQFVQRVYIDLRLPLNIFCGLTKTTTIVYIWRSFNYSTRLYYLRL